MPFANGERLDLYHLGRSALVWRYKQATFTTKDIDVVQMRTPLEEKAHALFGQGSVKAKELGLFLDLVPQGLPPLPGWFRQRSKEVPGNWQVIRLWELVGHDLAVTKLDVSSPGPPGFAFPVRSRRFASWQAPPIPGERVEMDYGERRQRRARRRIC